LVNAKATGSTAFERMRANVEDWRAPSPDDQDSRSFVLAAVAGEDHLKDPNGIVWAR
jgi:hypothetical protein